MKVLAVAHENDLSGANKSLLGIISNLSKLVNFTVLVNQKNGELTDQLNKMGIKVIYYPYTWWYAHSRNNKFKKLGRVLIEGTNYYVHKQVSKKFINIIRKEQFDLVYTNTSTVDIGINIAERLLIPHVWHIREFGQEDFGFQNLQNKKKYIETFNKTNSVIAISQAIKNKYKRFIDPKKIKVVYNGFETNKLYVPLRQHDLKKLKIIVTGQVTAAKRTDHAIKACKNLIDRGIDLELHVAGNIDNAYLNSKVPHAKDYKWCIFHGQVNDIKSLREKMDLELICSQNEAFGRVTIEAMLAGLPVVGANTGGTKELITNGQNGFLYEFGDLEDLAHKILLLKNNPRLYKKIISSAQKFAQQFTIEKVSLNVYQEFEKQLKLSKKEE